MAKINRDNFSPVQDGQILKASDLTNDRNILATGIDDNQDQIYRVFFGEDNNNVLDTKASLLALPTPVDLAYYVVLTDESESDKTTLYQYVQATLNYDLKVSNYSLKGLFDGDVTVITAMWAGGTRTSEGVDEIHAARIKELSDLNNQDVKDTASPTFAGIKLFNGSGLAVATYDGNNITWLYQPLGTTEPVMAEMFKNLFLKVRATADIASGQHIQFDGILDLGGGLSVIKGKPGVPSELTAMPELMLGVATQPAIAVNNEECLVNWFGVVNNIDTSAFAVQEILFADTTSNDGVNDGGFTNVRPLAPDAQIRVASVFISDAVNGALLVRPDFGLALKDLHDVYFNGHTFIGDEIIKYDLANNRWILDNLNNHSFEKTGWGPDITDIMSFTLADNGTITITASQDIDYFIKNQKYTFLAGSKQVVIGDIVSSGQWFVTLNAAGNLVASQTAWGFIGINYVWCIEAYYNATSGEFTSRAYEFHGYEMSGVTHRNNHWATSTYLIGTGGIVSDAGANALNVTQFQIGDEDIVAQILDVDVPAGNFQQPLTPLLAYKYHRIGASELFRIDQDNEVGLNSGGVLQYNMFNGSVYSLEDVTNGWFAAYWAVYTTDPDQPVKIWVGQTQADSIDNLIAISGIDSMSFGSIPVEEQKTAFRIILERTGSNYAIVQIDNFLIDPKTGAVVNPSTSHGALTGLLDDDHTQYGFRNLNTYSIEKLIGDIDDNDLMHYYDNIATLAKKIKLSTLKAWIIATSGTFDPSLDYYLDGLGAYKSRITKIQLMVLDNLGDYKATLLAPVLRDAGKMEFPLSEGNTNPLRVSMENGANYKNVFFDGRQVLAYEVNRKIVDYHYDGTNIVIEDLIEELITTEFNKAQGTFDKDIDDLAVLINGANNQIPMLNYKGATLIQLLLDGDMSSDVNWSGLRVDSTVNDNELIGTSNVTGTASFGPYQDIVTSLTDHYWTIEYFIPSANVGTINEVKIVLFDSSFGSAVTIVTGVDFTTDKWIKLSGIGQPLSNDVRMTLFCDTTAGVTIGDIIKGRNARSIPAEGRTLSEMEALLDGTYLEGTQSVGSPKTFTQLLDNRQDFVAWEFTVGGAVNGDFLELVASGDDRTYQTGIVLTGDTTYTLLAWVVENTLDTPLSFGGTGADDFNGVIEMTGIGVFKNTIKTNASIVNGGRGDLRNNTATAGTRAKYKAVLIKGDHTNISDAEALKIIKREEFGDFERKGVTIPSRGKNQVNTNNLSRETIDDSGVISDSTSIVRDNNLTKIVQGNNYVYSSSGTQIGGQDLTINRVAEYDAGRNFIRRVSIGVTNPALYIPSSDAIYFDAYYRTLALATIDEEDVRNALPMFELKNVLPATIHADFIEQFTHVDGELHGIGGVEDDLDTQKFGKDLNGVVQSTTAWSPFVELTDTIVFFKDLDTIIGFKKVSNDNEQANINLQINGTVFVPTTRNISDITDIESVATDNNGILHIRILKSKLGGVTSGDFETYLQANDVKFIYELATPLKRTEANNNEIDVDGLLVVTQGGTYKQSSPQGIVNSFTFDNGDTFADRTQVINNALKYLNDKAKEFGLQIDYNVEDIAAKEAYIMNNIIDIAAIKDITDFITVTANINLDTVKANSEASKVITDLITVTGAINLDDLKTEVEANTARGIKTETSSIIKNIAEWLTDPATIRIYRVSTTSGVETTFDIVSVKHDTSFSDHALVYSTGDINTLTRVTTNSATWTRVYFG